jgi:integrase
MPFRTAKTKIYQYDIQVGGRRFRGSTGTDDFEQAKAIEAEVRRNAKAKPASEYTLSEAFGTYHLEVCQYQPSAGTSASQAKAILRHISAKTRLTDLEQSDIMRMTQKMRASCANATVNRRLQYMGRALRHMAKHHRAALPDLDFRAAQVKEAKERVRELTLAEQDRLFEHLPHDLHEPVKFCLLTGCRISTMAGLLWSDVGDAEIYFRLKGGERMTFPITRELRALLSALPKSNRPHDRKHVFTRLDKTHLERIAIVPKGGVFNAEFRKAVRDAQIPDFRFHDLRHTFATRMLRQTKNLKLVSKLLGHKDIATTSRYAHVLVDDMRDALEDFSPLSGGVSQNKPQSVRR